MSEHKVACALVYTCEYHGYPSICKDCKNNTAVTSTKIKKYDCYNKKDGVR